MYGNIVENTQNLGAFTVRYYVFFSGNDSENLKLKFSVLLRRVEW
jgi:hypothetical protein